MIDRNVQGLYKAECKSIVDQSYCFLPFKLPGLLLKYVSISHRGWHEFRPILVFYEWILTYKSLHPNTELSLRLEGKRVSCRGAN